MPTGPAESPVEQIWAERVAAPNRALPASTLSDVVKVGNGWSGTIQLPPGERSTDHALAATALVTSAFERPLGSVVIEATDDGVASRARLLVLDRNPLHEVQHFTGPALDPATGLAPAGVYPDGQAGLFRFFQPGSGAVHFLVSGATGSGKSRFLDWMLVEATHSGLIVPWLGDPQGGQSLPRWVDHLDWAALSAPEILRMLRAATRVMAGRQRRLARAEWTDAHGRRLRGKQWFDPTPDMPLLLVVLDEAHDVLKNAEAVTLVEGIGKMGRKTGVGIGLATQLPSVAELGGSMVIRSMVSSGNVVVFRTADRLTGQMAFSGALPVDPARLPREFPPAVPGGPPRPSSGLGFLLGPSARTAPWRNYYVADPYHWATTRPDLGLEAAAAADAGEDYATRHQRAAGDDATCPTPAGDGPPPSARLAPVVPLTTAAGPVPQPAGRRWLREGTATDTVVALLTRHGETGRGDLIAASGSSPRAVTDALAALVEAGRVTKTGHGRYRLRDPPLA